MKNGDKVYSTCEEVFNDDEPDYDIGDHYYSGTVKSIKPSTLVNNFTVENILEVMEEMLFEEVGELAEDNLTLPEEKNDDLLQLIKDFMDKHAKVSCYKVVDVEEHTLGHIAYTSKDVPYHLIIEVGEDLFSRLHSPYFISHCTDTVKYMCANEQETKHLNELGINIEDVKWDYYKIINVEAK